MYHGDGCSFVGVCAELVVMLGKLNLDGKGRMMRIESCLYWMLVYSGGGGLRVETSEGE